MLPRHLEDKEVVILNSLSEAYNDHYELVEDEYLAANDDTRLHQLGYSDSEIEKMDEEKIQDLEYECREKRFLDFCIASNKIVKSQFGLLLVLN